MQEKLNTEEIRQKAEEELQFLLEDSRQYLTDEEVEELRKLAIEVEQKKENGEADEFDNSLVIAWRKLAGEKIHRERMKNINLEEIEKMDFYAKAERQATKDEIKEDETLNNNLIYEAGEFFPECDDIGHYEGSEDVPSFVPVEETDLWRCNRKTKEWHKGSDKF